MEQVYFQQAEVTVTNTRFVVGSQTYAMRNVTSVNIVRYDPSRGGPIALIIIGLLVTIVGFAGLSAWLGVVGLVPIGLAILWFVRQKATFGVVLTTSGGEIRAIEHGDWPLIENIVNALNESIMSHA